MWAGLCQVQDYWRDAKINDIEVANWALPMTFLAMTFLASIYSNKYVIQLLNKEL